jgi:hypothetical protein
MKRYVCVDEPDLYMPAGRFRPCFWHGSATSARQTGAISDQADSVSPTQLIRSPPRAYIKTYHLSSGSPAIPPQFKASVLVSRARQERFAYLN